VENHGKPLGSMDFDPIKHQPLPYCQESGPDFIAMALDRNQSLCSKLGMAQNG